MSVFETLKDALNTVPQGLSAGIKSLTSSTVSSHSKSPSDHVDLDTGADLLDRFQQSWADMHQNAENNATLAQQCDGVLTDIYLKCGQQNDSLNCLMSMVSGLPQLLMDIDGLVQKIGQLEGQFSEMESELVELENLSEQVELRKNKLHHQYQLLSYRQRRNMELETVKVKLAKEHAHRAQGYEKKLQERIRERQEVFEQTFHEEMQHYRKYGNTQLKPVLLGSDPVDLAEVSIEQDPAALNDFLRSVEASNHDNTTEPEDSTCPELDDPEDDIPGSICGTVVIIQDEDLEEVPGNMVTKDNTNSISIETTEIPETCDEQKTTANGSGTKDAEKCLELENLSLDSPKVEQTADHEPEKDAGVNNNNKEKDS